MSPDEKLAARDTNVGRRLGNYELTQRIGEGGMGVVYLARCGSHTASVGLKLIKKGWTPRSSFGALKMNAASWPR